jgi:hypothetical protein
MVKSSTLEGKEKQDEIIKETSNQRMKKGGGGKDVKQ